MKNLFDSDKHPVIYNASGNQTQRSEVYFIVILYFCQNSFFPYYISFSMDDSHEREIWGMRVSDEYALSYSLCVSISSLSCPFYVSMFSFLSFQKAPHILKMLAVSQLNPSLLPRRIHIVPPLTFL